MSHIREILTSPSLAHLDLLHNDSFLAFLSEKDCSDLENENEGRWALFNPSEALTSVHPSWYKQRISQLPEHKRAFFEPIQGLLYADANAPGALPSSIRIWLLSQLLVSCKDLRHSLDHNAIESASLGFLLKKSQSDLEVLFVCLGCHALAETLRKVISQKELTRVLSVLDPACRRYLRKLLFAHKKMAVEPLDPQVLTAKPQKLREIVQENGRQVFRKIFQTENEAFRWYFAHQFDVAFADSIMKPAASTGAEYSKEVADIWVSVIHDILNYIEASGESSSSG